MSIYKDLQLQKIPNEWLLVSKPSTTNVHSFLESHLSIKELEITTTPTLKLLANIHNSKWTSLDVLLAFSHRAIISQQITNSLSEIFLEKGIQRAKELDEYLKTQGKPIGPLHGFPISLKDEFDLKGIRTTLGVEKLINSEPLTQSSPNIEILYKAGAVFYVKTNVPLAVFNVVTYNPVFGETLNPYNTNFNAGGSSGGEACLLALRGSALGVGTDLAGSIRQPSSFQGLYGFKPSSGRVPHYNSKIVVNGMESLPGTNGPIANDIDALELYLKTIINAKPWEIDTKVVPIRWKEDIKIETPKFAILLDDGIIKPTPPVQRALKIVKKKLELQGYEIIEWNDFELTSISKFANIFMGSNGLKKFHDYTGAEIITDLKVSELWELQDERSRLVNNFWKKWKSLGIDGLILPVSAYAGVKKDDFKDVTYCPLPNVLDFPAAAFPVTKGTVDDIGSIEPRNDTEKAVWDSYNPKESDGVPVGLQIIGAKLQEEKTLALLRIIDDVLKE